MTAVSSSPKELLQQARLALDTAFQAYFILKSSPPRKMTGFRNVIVFGTAVKQVLQDFPSASPEFDKWYKPIRKEFKVSVLMKLFDQLQGEIRKRDAQGVDSQARLRGFNYPDDLPKLGKPPTNSREFFMGDDIGGTGWQVELFPGVVQKYYAIIPPAYGTAEEFLSFTAVAQTSQDTRGLDAVRVSEQYLTSLEKVLRGAEQHLAPA